MFGGNSNWRGPIWMPVNLLIIRALLQYHHYYGDDFKVECPTGSGDEMTLFEVAKEIAQPADSHLPARRATAAARSTAAREMFQNDPHWRDLHPLLRVLPRRQRRGPRREPPDRLDRGRRKLIQLFATTDAETLLQGGTRPVTTPYHRTPVTAGENT